MSRPGGSFAVGVLVGVVSLAAGSSLSAMAQDTPPNFAPDRHIGWYAYNRLFIPPARGAGPVRQDAARPYVSNDEFRVTGRQPTQRVADLNSPILQPWQGRWSASATRMSCPESALARRPRVAGRKA
jgi:hypothetical protein